MASFAEQAQASGLKKHHPSVLEPHYKCDDLIAGFELEPPDNSGLEHHWPTMEVAARELKGTDFSICRFELERPENFGLERGWPTIEAVAGELKGTPAEGLSLADLVALGGAWAVHVTGGPSIVIPVGAACLLGPCLHFDCMSTNAWRQLLRGCI